MFYRNKKTRKYQAPVAIATHMVLESNFCQTVRFLIDVEDYDIINAGDDAATAGEYFEPIVS